VPVQPGVAGWLSASERLIVRHVKFFVDYVHDLFYKQLHQIKLKRGRFRHLTRACADEISPVGERPDWSTNEARH